VSVLREPDDAAYPMPAGRPPGRRKPAGSGLWERKKAKTRAAMREQAFRLFREQGYDATTVEQIAEAAEVSPSTFFRYFPTKEDVVLQDDMDLLWVDAIRAQSPELGPMTALRNAVHDLFSGLTPAEVEQMRESAELTASVPAIRVRTMDEFVRMGGIIAQVAAERSGRDAEDVEVRAFAGAVLGVVVVAWLGASGDLAKFLRDLDQGTELLESGLRL